MIYHSGHGGTLWTPYQPANLHNNKTANFVYTEGCDSGNFGITTNSEAELWMNDDGGMVAGIVNSAYGWFIASTWYSEQMFKIMFNDTYDMHERCFAKAHNLARLDVGWELHSVAPMIVKETNFLGDPALEFKFWNNSMTETPVNNSDYISVYNVTLRYKPDLTGNVSFYWNNGTLISIIHNVVKGTYANTTISYRLAHNTTYRWYTIINSEKSRIFNFKTSQAADINEDEDIDFVDTSQLVKDFGWTGTPGSLPSDINEDGHVNNFDVSALINSYGEIF